MRIYFAGSIRAGRGDAPVYQQLVGELEKYGEVLTEHVATVGEEEMSDGEIFARDLEWLTTCDAVVAEVSTPSLGVGFEIGIAQSLTIPVLGLYRVGAKHKLSAMLAGNPGITVAEYATIEDAVAVLRSWFAQG